MAPPSNSTIASEGAFPCVASTTLMEGSVERAYAEKMLKKKVASTAKQFDLVMLRGGSLREGIGPMDSERKDPYSQF